jgi:hypothetical protein
MPHDIIDNRDERLVDHIRRILPGGQAVDFVASCLFDGTSSHHERLLTTRDENAPARCRSALLATGLRTGAHGTGLGRETFVQRGAQRRNGDSGATRGGR